MVALSESLYPPTTYMPDIPRAEDVFNEYKRTVRVQETPSVQIVKHNNLIRERSQSFQQYQHTPNPIEDDENDHEIYERPLIEVSPGQFAELRGSKETMNALLSKFSREIVCACCSTRIEFIRDAAMVICPSCRVVIPLDNKNGRGLGLGVKVQSEINRRSKDQFSMISDTDQYSMKDTKCAPKERNCDNFGESIRRVREPTTNISVHRAREEI